jgi:hypothetical protein
MSSSIKVIDFQDKLIEKIKFCQFIDSKYFPLVHLAQLYNFVFSLFGQILLQKMFL